MDIVRFVHKDRLLEKIISVNVQLAKSSLMESVLQSVLQVSLLMSTDIAMSVLLWR